MKLKEFNDSNTPVIRNAAPSISDNKHGVFTLNKPAVALLNLKAKDRIVIHQDEEDAQCFYVEKCKDRGFELRLQNSAEDYLIFNNSSVAKVIREIFNQGSNTFRMLIAGQPTKFEKRELWGLLQLPKL